MAVGAQFIAPKDGWGGVHVGTRGVVETFALPPPSLGAMNCAPTGMNSRIWLSKFIRGRICYRRNNIFSVEPKKAVGWTRIAAPVGHASTHAWSL